jgi:hypothetical protein
VGNADAEIEVEAEREETEVERDVDVDVDTEATEADKDADAEVDIGVDADVDIMGAADANIGAEVEGGGGGFEFECGVGVVGVAFAFRVATAVCGVAAESFRVAVPVAFPGSVFAATDAVFAATAAAGFDDVPAGCVFELFVGVGMGFGGGGAVFLPEELVFCGCSCGNVGECVLGWGWVGTVWVWAVRGGVRDCDCVGCRGGTGGEDGREAEGRNRISSVESGITKCGE